MPDLTFRDLGSFDAAILIDIHALITDDVRAAIYFSQVAERFECSPPPDDLSKYRLGEEAREAAVDNAVTNGGISATVTAESR